MRRTKITVAAPDEQPHVVLLSDDPSESDGFEAGAHQRVALAIAELIRREDGGRVIGLEGSWGSGKSTVVTLLKQLLSDRSVEGTPDTRIVVFDAWAHEGDRLRRTFLERLVAALSSNPAWLSEKRAAALTSELSGKSSRVKIRSTARLSLEGTSVAVATLFIPAGAALIGNHFQTYHRAAVEIGAAFILLPLIVVAAFSALLVIGRVGQSLLGSRVNRWYGKWVPWCVARRPFSFFAKEQVTKTETKGIERGEPTSVEFEEKFSTVLNEAVSDERRLLIVFDNIDRVDEDDAKVVLSTMQTFTGSGISDGSQRKPNVWTLIPYDRDGLGHLWSSATGQEVVAKPDEEQPPGNTDRAWEAYQHAPPTAFIDKIFQIRFEAPPLALSNWRAYLLQLLHEALPSAAEHELRSVVALRTLYPGVAPQRQHSPESPTPRQLKQFVNQIGAVQRQRDDINLATIAYFELLRRDRVRLADELIDGSVPHTKLRYLLGPEPEEDLAALCFGADRELAQQLLVGPRLDSALAAGDAETVKRLAKRTGFEDVLAVLDLEGLTTGGAVALTRAVSVLFSAQVFESEHVEAWLKERLEPLAHSITEWRLDGTASGAGLAYLLGRLAAGADAHLTELLRSVARDPLENDTDGHRQLEGAASLAEGLIRSGHSAETVQVPIAIPSERLTEALTFFGSLAQSAESRAALAITQTPSEVAEVLASEACSDEFSRVLGAVNVLTTSPSRLAAGELVSRCLAWLRENDPAIREQLETLLSVVDLLSTAPETAETLETAVTDGVFANLIALANTNSWHGETANASMLQLSLRSPLDTPESLRAAQPGIEALRAVLTTPSAHPEIVSAQRDWLIAHNSSAFELVMRVASVSADFEPWSNQQLQALEEKDALIVSAEQYRAEWEHLKDALGAGRFAHLTQALVLSDTIRANLLASPAAPALALVVFKAASDAFDAKDDRMKGVQRWASDQLKAATQGDWESALSQQEGGTLLDFALELAESKPRPKATGLDDALHTHFRAVAEDVSVWRPPGETLSKLVTLISSPARSALAADICAALHGMDGLVSAAFFPCYGEFLAGQSAFRRHQALPNVMARLVTNARWPDVAWFAQLAKKHGDTVDSQGREPATAYLAEKVAEKHAELGEEAPESLVALSELLGNEPLQATSSLRSELDTGEFRIHQAEYGTFPSPIIDVKQALQAMIVGDRLETIAANETAGSDPDPGTLKQMRIEYSHQGSDYTKTYDEGETISLP